jgi:hypothetical protein
MTSRKGDVSRDSVAELTGALAASAENGPWEATGTAAALGVQAPRSGLLPMPWLERRVVSSEVALGLLGYNPAHTNSPSAMQTVIHLLYDAERILSNLNFPFGSCWVLA